jgi:hypothetical protein
MTYGDELAWVRMAKIITFARGYGNTVVYIEVQTAITNNCKRKTMMLNVDQLTTYLVVTNKFVVSLTVRRL